MRVSEVERNERNGMSGLYACVIHSHFTHFKLFLHSESNCWMERGQPAVKWNKQRRNGSQAEEEFDEANAWSASKFNGVRAARAACRLSFFFCFCGSEKKNVSWLQRKARMKWNGVSGMRARAINSLNECQSFHPLSFHFIISLL